ncbi:hypothetical protein RND71_010563 [Anisodus tanguticus]|uniref:Uncharacterized protein n=1 Tax=Anisodus tanguticus TaxID=243964 RepID=A0AAE1SKJ5_9SOLA|nr:hypothetical protein RND71_010563 [Anisodus tanguticus]
MRQGQISQHAEFLRACGESNPRCLMPERLIAPRLCHWTMPRRTKTVVEPQSHMLDMIDQSGLRRRLDEKGKRLCEFFGSIQYKFIPQIMRAHNMEKASRKLLFLVAFWLIASGLSSQTRNHMHEIS